MNNFCTEGITDAKCYSFEPVEFDSEEQLFDILLDVLKSQLPTKMKALKDCQDKPMFIPEDAIDLYPPEKFVKFSVVLNPLGDVPSYAESRLRRDVVYNFELILTVQNELKRCVTWELLRFKNAVESLLMATELYIDGYLSAYITPRGFVYSVVEQNNNVYRRQGAYRFAVSVTQTKNSIGQ